MQPRLNVMKALADQNRFRVVAALLAHAELCACQISELLPVSGATVSRHMGILVQSGLAESRKEGRWIYYRLVSPPAAHISPILDWIGGGVDTSPELARDRQVLKVILAQDKAGLCRRQRGAACCPVPAGSHSDTNVQSDESKL